MSPKTCFMWCLALASAFGTTATAADEKVPATPVPAESAAPPAPAAQPAKADVPPPAAAEPRLDAAKPRGTAATLRLHPVGLNGGTVLYGATTVLLPQFEVGVYGEPVAARLVLGYTMLKQSRDYSGSYYGGSSSDDVTQHLLTIGGEVSYYFNPVRSGTLATYGVLRLAKVFLVTDRDDTGHYDSSDEEEDSPLLFGAGFGAEWHLVPAGVHSPRSEVCLSSGTRALESGDPDSSLGQAAGRQNQLGTRGPVCLAVERREHARICHHANLQLGPEGGFERPTSPRTLGFGGRLARRPRPGAADRGRGTETAATCRKRSRLRMSRYWTG